MTIGAYGLDVGTGGDQLYSAVHGEIAPIALASFST